MKSYKGFKRKFVHDDLKVFEIAGDNIMNYYLAVDIGASSGRLILSWKEDGKIFLEEIHRFENGMIKKKQSSGIASGKRFVINKKPKHQKDAKYGWYKYESRFALPVFRVDGELERYNVRHGEDN